MEDNQELEVCTPARGIEGVVRWAMWVHTRVSVCVRV